jgi:hypothetical protein
MRTAVRQANRLPTGSYAELSRSGSATPGLPDGGLETHMRRLFISAITVAAILTEALLLDVPVVAEPHFEA